MPEWVPGYIDYAEFETIVNRTVAYVWAFFKYNFFQIGNFSFNLYDIFLSGVFIFLGCSFIDTFFNYRER